MIDSYVRLWHCSSTIFLPPTLPHARGNSEAVNNIIWSGVAAKKDGGLKDQSRQARSGNARHGLERPDESISRMEPRFRIPTVPQAAVEMKDQHVCCHSGRQGPGAQLHDGRRQARVFIHGDQKAAVECLDDWAQPSRAGDRESVRLGEQEQGPKVPPCPCRRRSTLTLPSHSPKHGPPLVVCHEVSNSSPRVEGTPPSQRPHRILDECRC